MVCGYISYEPISDISSLLDCTKDLGIPFLILCLLLSFIAGLVFDAVRNGIVDNVLDGLIKWKILPKLFEVNWSFFFKENAEKVGYFYARYFTYYCFDYNLVLSLIASLVVIDIHSQLPHKMLVTWIGIIAIAVLKIDALSLRIEMRKATNLNNPNP
jgi:hypothetical protein